MNWHALQVTFMSTDLLVISLALKIIVSGLKIIEAVAQLDKAL